MHDVRWDFRASGAVKGSPEGFLAPEAKAHLADACERKLGFVAPKGGDANAATTSGRHGRPCGGTQGYSRG